MKSTFFFIILSLFFIGCQSEDVLEDTSLVDGKTYSHGLIVKGHTFDNLIIQNSSFSGKALTIENADNVTIENCTFNDINDNGIRVIKSSNIVINNCSFQNIGFNGIDSHEQASGGTISNCTFQSCALSEIGKAMGQAHHSIYWKGEEVLIAQNNFDGASQPYGELISVRSSGIIRKNSIKNSPENGIKYYSDHPGGDTLLIENNILYNNSEYAISLGSSGKLSNHNNNIVIRFNTMAQDNDYESIYVNKDFQTTTNIAIYGNIAINPNKESLKTFYTLSNVTTNLEDTGDIGFVNYSGGNLHITASSSAIGYATTISDYPTTDYDGDTRTQATMDAGADEYN